MISNIRLNSTSSSTSKDRIKDADSRKKKATESIKDGWIRVGNTKLTVKEREIFDLTKKAYEQGKVALPEGLTRLTKVAVMKVGRDLYDERESELRTQRIKETIDTKPDNYFVLTKDSELSEFVDNIRQEVRLQRKEWAGRFEMLDVDSMTAGDFEGTGIDSYIDLTIGFSIWLPILDKGYYLAYGHVPGFDVPYAFKAGEALLTRSKAILAISPYLKSEGQGKTFHMGSTRYDMHVAINDGYHMGGVVWDTLDAMRTMNEKEESFALKSITRKYGQLFGVDGSVYSFDDLFGNRSPAPFNTEIVGIYAINDVKYGWALFEWQFELMKKTDRLLESYVMVEKDLPTTDTFMGRCGFELDFDLLRELKKEFETEVEEAKKLVVETYSIDEEFVRKADRTINAKKIDKWIEAQTNRITKKREQIKKKTEIMKDLELEGKTHLKRYANEKDMYEKYKREYEAMPEATIENAPQEIEEFVITNGNHLAYLIHDVLGIKDRTYLVDRKKKRSTAAAVLDYYYEEEPTLKPMAMVAEYTKLLTTYINPYLSTDPESCAVENTGRVHTKFDAGGTNTGRYSSSSYDGRPSDVLDEYKQGVDK